MNETNQQIETTKLVNLRKLLYLGDNFNLIKDACRHTSTPENIINEGFICARLNPKLLECTPYSWVNALVDAAIMGLPMTGISGKAWLTKRWSKAHQAHLVQYMLGWRGMLDIVYRTKLFKRIDAGVVYQGDEFHFERGMDQHLKHVPDMTVNRKDENTTAFYVEGLLTNGEYKFEVMTSEEVRKIQKEYASTSNVWKNHFTEQGKKTAMRRFWKWLPDHVEFQLAEAIDNANNPLAQADKAVALTPDMSGNAKLLAATKPPADDPETPPADTPGEVVKGHEVGSPEWHAEQIRRAKEEIAGMAPEDLPPGAFDDELKIDCKCDDDLPIKDDDECDVAYLPPGVEDAPADTATATADLFRED